MAVDVAPAAGSPVQGARRRLFAAFWRHPWLKALALLTPPVGGYLVVYVGSLVVLFVSSFWAVDAFTGRIVHQWTVDNFTQVFSLSDPTYLKIALRTVWVAAAVTLADAVVALPFAYYMARVASRRTRAALFVLVLLPLWSSYLVRIYAWRTILAHDGPLNWTLHGVGLPNAGLLYTNWGMWIVFSYVWLPFMVLPVYAAIERIPDTYLEASSDLGGRGARTFRSVVLPLVLPGLVAGSIFTFSLTLGDYITPLLVGGPSSSFIGNVVYDFIGLSGNQPFAAAFATVPVLIMAAYLVVARKLGAFEAL